MNEIWKPLPSDDVYEVSNFGAVRSYLARAFGPPRVLTPWTDDEGYQRVQLRVAGSRKVHQLVLEAFVGPRPVGAVTRHLDGVRDHNTLPNLAWGTHMENVADRKVHGTEHNLNKTVCRNGHPYSPENTQVARRSGTDRTYRLCRICRQGTRRRNYLRTRAVPIINGKVADIK